MSQNISEQQVRHISQLARLKPTDEEVRQFSKQLSDILAYMDQLNEVDTENVPPTAHAVAVHNVFRPDEPGACFGPDQALSNAPQRDGSFFAVPKVLDRDSGT